MNQDNGKKIIIKISQTTISFLGLRSGKSLLQKAYAGSYKLEQGNIPLEFVTALKIFGINQKAEVFLLLPRRKVIMKYLSVPAQDKAEIKRIVEMMIADGLPFPQEEIVYDLSTGQTDQQGYTKVIAAIAPLEMIEAQINLLKKINIAPQRSLVSAFGIANWYGNEFTADAQDLVLIANAEDSGLEICLVLGKHLLFSRFFSFQDQTSIEEIKKQLKLTLDAFKQEYPDARISKLVLTGIKQKIDFLNNIFAESLKMPARLVYSERYIDLDIISDDPVNMPSEQGALIALLGFSLDPDCGVNLIPRSVLDQRVKLKKQKAILNFFVALLLTLGLFAFCLGIDVYQRFSYLNQLRDRSAFFQEKARVAGKRVDFLSLIQKNLYNKVYIADILKELYQLIPQNASLSSLSLSDDELKIQGQTSQNADVNLIQKAMVDSDLFKDVNLQFVNRRQRYGLEYTEFMLSCRLKNLGDKTR